MGRPFTFVLSHAMGDAPLVLAAETEKEMHEWMQAVRAAEGWNGRSGEGSGGAGD